MRYLIGVFTLVLVLGISLSAQAEVQNVRVSGDVQVRGISRDTMNLNEKTRGSYNYVDDNWYDSTVRLQVDAELTDDVAAVIRFINERDWDTSGSGSGDNEDDIELDLGYLTLDNMFGYPVMASIGRQEILFGEGFLVGDGYNEVVDTNAGGDYDLAYGKSIRRAFDALRLTYSAEPYTVDVFTAKIDEDFGAQASSSGEVDLNGININYDYLDIATFDLGYFVKHDTSNTATEGTTKALSLRVEGEFPTLSALTIRGEYVLEDGNVGMANTRGTDEIDANAWYLGAEYAFEDNLYQPYIGATYLFASGDKESGSPSNDDEQFDPLYEDRELGVIAELLPSGIGGEIQTNYEGWKLAAGLKPTETLSLDIAYAVFDRDEVSASVSDDLFDELDVTLTYDYTEDVQFGLSAAWFSPGKYYKDTYGADYDEKATQIVGSVKVSF